MKDYAAMSDGKIAEEVAKFIELGDRKQKGDGTLYIKNNVWNRFDPCNNPADAWPIMLESKISIMWQTAEESWCAWANGDLEEGCWYWKYCPDDYHVHASALRAAMIVFLMMKEGE